VNDYLVICGAVPPLVLLDKIAMYLYTSVIPLGVHTIAAVGIVFAFVLFAIALSITYITLVTRADKGKESKHAISQSIEYSERTN
jgi:hypothetical protein